MVRSGVSENFTIVCDSLGSRARIAMRGAQGTEILVVLVLEADLPHDSDATRSLILQEGEDRLRSALLALIAERWPNDELQSTHADHERGA